MAKRVVCFFKSFIFIVTAAILGVTALTFSLCMDNIGLLSNKNINSLYINSEINIRDLFRKFFTSPFKNIDDENLPPEYVYVGGFPIGILIENDGVVVIAKGKVSTSLGEYDTCTKSDIKAGDIITHIDNKKISSILDISNYLANDYITGTTVDIVLNRNNAIINTTITPALDITTNKYRLGLWVRDTASGVGTVTFVKENGEFSALGHPISDVDTSSKIDVKMGNAYKCNIIGVKKGNIGNPGELKGLFLRNTPSIGTIRKNTAFGIKGKLSDDYFENLKLKKYRVGRKGSVKTGKAKIISTIDGLNPEEFDIEIVKTSLQNSPDNKSMIIHVTDKDLLERTGGIVQGMSGSPIIQDGKIVGAVTHVLVNDPTRGYGLYMDWMID